MAEPTLYERLGGVYAISAVVDTGLSLGDAHFDFQFTPAEFDEVAGVLAASLDHSNVPEAEKEEVLAAFAAHKPAVAAGSILRK